MIGVALPDRVETDLAASAIACPGCGGALRPWGHARARRVRDLTMTHVLLPGTVLPRRADTTAVIGTALLASARGAGHRQIAADLARPAVTVRRWLRAVRGEHLEWLRVQAVARLARLDRDVISALAPSGSRLGDALHALAAAALAQQTRLAPHIPVWDVVAAVTRWRLLPLPSD